MESGNKIPKIIHYCWFGKGKKDKKIIEYINTWEKVMPDYQIIEWNEDNFPIDYNKYCLKAYKEKKYAFVSDVARLYALYEMGGIYFDTDVEAIKSMDILLDKKLVFAFESNRTVMTGIIASTKENAFIKNWLDTYEELSFYNENGSIDTTPNTFRVTDLLISKGMVQNGEYQELTDGTCILKTEVLGAYDVDNSCFINTENTIAIHHCTNTWMPLPYKIKDKLKRKLASYLGRETYQKIRIVLKGKR